MKCSPSPSANPSPALLDLLARQILRGIKTVEYRSGPTRIIGERFHIYASKGKLWFRDLSMPKRKPPAWLIELAEQVGLIEPGAILPTGVIVGSAVIEKVTQDDDLFHWHLMDVQRIETLRKPRRHPQPV